MHGRGDQRSPELSLDIFSIFAHSLYFHKPCRGRRPRRPVPRTHVLPFITQTSITAQFMCRGDLSPHLPYPSNFRLTPHCICVHSAIEKIPTSKIQQLRRYLSERDAEGVVPYNYELWQVLSTGEQCSPLQIIRDRFFRRKIAPLGTCAQLCSAMLIPHTLSSLNSALHTILRNSVGVFPKCVLNLFMNPYSLL